MTLLAACSGMANAPAPLAGSLTPPPTTGYLTIKPTEGYLAAGDAPNSLIFLPSPPAPGSAALAVDEAAYRAARLLRGTKRWELAIEDAKLDFPVATKAFSCALNAPITADVLPNLQKLLYRSGHDTILALNTAKQHYQRIRPFVAMREDSCTPADEDHLRHNGSYPSGHAAIGWTMALILAEIAPGQVDALLSRAHAFGQSRVVCGVHWHSDIAPAQTVAAGVVARLHAEPAFRAQMEAARSELAAAHAKGLKPERDCLAEAAALALPSQYLP